MDVDEVARDDGGKCAGIVQPQNETKDTSELPLSTWMRGEHPREIS